MDAATAIAYTLNPKHRASVDAATVIGEMTCMYPPPHMTCMYPPPQTQDTASVDAATVIGEIWRKGGPKGFFRGLGSRCVWAGAIIAVRSTSDTDH